MAVPYPIANGQTPSGTKLQANLAYLEGLVLGGQALKTDTFAALRVYAALNPTVAFMCVASDYKFFMLYCGDTASGDGGFHTLLDFTPAT